MRKVHSYNAEDYFEPVVNRAGELKIIAREHYLLSSREVLEIPPNLSVELDRHSTLGLSGPVDFAGFIDPGFIGDLVFELRSDELRDVTLDSGAMPISQLRLFRSKVPDKIYGQKSGANYQGQVGIRPAKHFNAIDFAEMARDYPKLSKRVLTQDADLLLKHRTSGEGFQWISPERAKKLITEINSGFWHWRYDCEPDESILQPIPYVVIFDNQGNVYSYVRASNIQNYGDMRLHGKHSIGLGGHILQKDSPDFVTSCLNREVFQEEVKVSGEYRQPLLLGTLFARDKPVDRVHFGLIYCVGVKGSVKQKEDSIKKNSGRMISIEQIAADPEIGEKYETWSRILIPKLAEMYSRTWN